MTPSSSEERARLARALHVVHIVGIEAATRWKHLDIVLSCGVSALWLRQPGATGAELYRAARDLLPRCTAYGAALVIGDRADVAQAVGTPFVQLGVRSPPARRVAPWFAGNVGVSCHSERELRRAAEAGASYAVLSPVFGVPAKGVPLGVERFRRMVAEAPLPVVALGGIDSSNVDAVRTTAAAGVAVIRALRDADDPGTIARQLAAGVAAR